MNFRPLQESDAPLLFKWRSDDLVIQTSESQKAPSFDEHAAWMVERLFRAHWKVLIAEIDGAPIGTVTFRVNPSAQVSLSYMVAEQFRGRGFGRQLVAAALTFMGPCLVWVKIRADNLRSIAAVEASGFEIGPAQDGWVFGKKVAL